MEYIAIIYLVLAITLLITPGSMFLKKPEIDFQSPKLYMSIAQTIAGITLAILAFF